MTSLESSDKTKILPKHLVALDVHRGIAIFGMTLFHGFFNS